jgi:hypothetical protein
MNTYIYEVYVDAYEYRPIFSFLEPPMPIQLKPLYIYAYMYINMYDNIYDNVHENINIYDVRL